MTIMPDNYLSDLIYWLDKERHHTALATHARVIGNTELEHEHAQLAHRAGCTIARLARAEVSTYAH